MSDNIRVALCLWGTMRAPNNSLPTLYENIIKPWNTDVIVCVNNHYDDDKERVNKLRELGANIIEESISVQEDVPNVVPESIHKKLVPLALERIKHYGPCQVNYLAPLAGGSHSSLINRLNWYRLSYLVERHINEYDYFLITRPDHVYLFPMFDKSFLKDDEIINCNEHAHGGMNADFIIVSNKMVLSWLRKHLDYIYDDSLQDIFINELNKSILWNAEYYSLVISKLCEYKIRPVSINGFISADSMNEKTSYKGVAYDGEHYYKYEEQYFSCRHNFELWKSGYRWKNEVDKIVLAKDT